MARIKIYCKGCKTESEVDRTEEIPDDVISLNCNWCPLCEDEANDYYMEDYNYIEINEVKDPNQLNLL
jgi:hypothetical protein